MPRRPMTKATLSRDAPSILLTSVAKDRLPVFRTQPLADLAVKALDEARQSGGFKLYAYVLMPDHLHAIAEGAKPPSEIARYVNGIIGRRVIDHLKREGHSASLAKLRIQERSNRYRYSLWDHHANTFLITSEAVFMQKVNYLHQNPVGAGLVKKAEQYRWSSVRVWKEQLMPDEPLITDHLQIVWRKAR